MSNAILTFYISWTTFTHISNEILTFLKGLHTTHQQLYIFPMKYQHFGWAVTLLHIFTITYWHFYWIYVPYEISCISNDILTLCTHLYIFPMKYWNFGRIYVPDIFAYISNEILTFWIISLFFLQRNIDVFM